MSGKDRAAARGEGAFRERYRALYGERWAMLESALGSPPDSVAFRAAPGSEPYYLDSASVFAAGALDLGAPAGPEGEALPVLDACAAPGGKSLVLASRLPPGSRLVANELSADRRRRLAAVLDRHLPPELRARVDIRGSDAAALCRRLPAAFGAILLDAPCSSERHVLADPAALAEWSPARTRNLAARQWALLSSAFIMLAPGGCLVYSTCSLSPEENEQVAARLAAKAGAEAVFEELREPRAERLGRGLIFLPDAAGGAGPLYVCRVQKAPSRA
ncbi:MAG TPA: 16S rRNA methyltransferase [Spirochaetales bacterium]|nr:16S rRNA methyltransferase [Spirochaetales bacterium]HRY53413.1 16S rRNA methyltransferase [Spirochaetia bacterium]HRZ63555.1 16S rRNA methyltransferase [Spirochaetia bacterium]